MWVRSSISFSATIIPLLTRPRSTENSKQISFCLFSFSKTVPPDEDSANSETDWLTSLSLLLHSLSSCMNNSFFLLHGLLEHLALFLFHILIYLILFELSKREFLNRMLFWLHLLLRLLRSAILSPIRHFSVAMRIQSNREIF